MNLGDTTTLTLTNSPDPIVWIVLLLMLIISAWWCYGTNKDSVYTRITLFFIRALILIFFLLLLFQPAIETTKQIHTIDQVVILVDRSSSMNVEDVLDGTKRISDTSKYQTQMKPQQQQDAELILQMLYWVLSKKRRQHQPVASFF